MLKNKDPPREIFDLSSTPLSVFVPYNTVPDGRSSLIDQPPTGFVPVRPFLTGSAPDSGWYKSPSATAPNLPGLGVEFNTMTASAKPFLKLTVTDSTATESISGFSFQFLKFVFFQEHCFFQRHVTERCACISF
jgi:hypothetical protein